jgi:hypothetical protein
MAEVTIVWQCTEDQALTVAVEADETGYPDALDQMTGRALHLFREALASIAVPEPETT